MVPLQAVQEYAAVASVDNGAHDRATQTDANAQSRPRLQRRAQLLSYVAHHQSLLPTTFHRPHRYLAFPAP